MSVSRLFVSLGACAVLLVAVQLSAQQPAPPATPSAPSGNVEHGRYIVERVVMCYECHSARDPQGNIVAGTRFKGGAMPMRPTWKADWPLQIPRIAGLPGYTDAEAMRLADSGRDQARRHATALPDATVPDDASGRGGCDRVFENAVVGSRR